MPTTPDPGRSRRETNPFVDGCARLGPRLMHDLGLTDIQAAGLLGNLGHESGGFQTLQERRPVVKGSRGGWGLAQWTGPRRRAMEAWCHTRGLDPADPEANYGYLCEELRGSEAATLVALKRTATLESATETFCTLFERPGVVALDSRLAWSRRALAAIRAGLAADAVVTAAPVPRPRAATMSKMGPGARPRG